MADENRPEGQHPDPQDGPRHRADGVTGDDSTQSPAESPSIPAGYDPLSSGPLPPSPPPPMPRYTPQDQPQDGQHRSAPPPRGDSPYQQPPPEQPTASKSQQPRQGRPPQSNSPHEPPPGRPAEPRSPYGQPPQGQPPHRPAPGQPGPGRAPYSQAPQGHRPQGQPPQGQQPQGQPSQGRPQGQRPGRSQPPYGASPGQAPYGESELPGFGRQPNRPTPMPQGQRPAEQATPQGPPPWAPVGEQRPQAPAQPPGGRPPAQRLPTGAARPAPDEPPPSTTLRTPRLIGVLALVLVSLLTTAAVVAWIWNKADAVTPVDLPSAAGSPLPTVNPSVKPTTPPPPPEPEGKYLGGFLINHLGDRMPKMPGVWKGEPNDGMGVRGAALEQFVVYKDASGEPIWSNFVSLGTLNKVLIAEYRSSANLRAVTPRQAGIVMGRLYGEKARPTNITRRSVKVDGHQAFEVTARIPVKEAKVPRERFSLLAVTLIDRGDGTATVAAAVFAGTQPAWLNVWRKQVQKIQMSR